jgi:hypothetical protein
MEMLQEAYQMAKSNKGAPGIDGITFDAIEESGVGSFLKQIQDELVHNTYRPMPVRKKEIPKDGGTKVRVLSIPAIRDRVVQGALKYILEPINFRLARNLPGIDGMRQWSLELSQTDSRASADLPSTDMVWRLSPDQRRSSASDDCCQDSR